MTFSFEEQAASVAAPTVKAVNRETGMFDPDYNRVSFEGEVADIAAYLEKINEVTVGQKIYQAGSFWKATDKYKTANDPIYGGKDIYLDLIVESGFSTTADTTVVVKAEGYDDLTLKVDKEGNLVQP